MIIKDLRAPQHPFWRQFKTPKSPNGERYVVEDINRLTIDIENSDILSDWRMVFHEAADWIAANGKITLTVREGRSINDERFIVVDACCKTRQAARDFVNKWSDLPKQSRFFNNRYPINPHRVWPDTDSGDIDFLPYRVSNINKDVCDYQEFEGMFEYCELWGYTPFGIIERYALFTRENDAILAKLMFG